MWSCPKCGRTFRSTNQSHYCGKAPQTIDDYIQEQPEYVRPHLRTLRDAIHAAIPDAREKISWSMPTFWNGCNLIQFAAFRSHIGLYPGTEAVEAFADRLTDFQTSKGTIRLAIDRPLPLELIAEIARWCDAAYSKKQLDKAAAESACDGLLS